MQRMADGIQPSIGSVAGPKQLGGLGVLHSFPGGSKYREKPTTPTD